jgi:hypothetical protein
VLALILASDFVTVIDISIVITGLPKVGAELAFSPTDIRADPGSGQRGHRDRAGRYDPHAAR